MFGTTFVAAALLLTGPTLTQAQAMGLAEKLIALEHEPMGSFE